MKRSVNALDLWFRPDGASKLYKVRIDDPKQGLSSEQIRSACDEIEKSKVFDFDGFAVPYHLVKAHYYHRDSRSVIE